MKPKILIYQKPTCSKCRETLKLLRESGQDFESINYYETPFTAQDLHGLLKKLRLSARDLLRRDESIVRTLGIRPEEVADAELIELMVQHPDLIQRPIVVRGSKAILGRPPENVKTLL
jgi:arsenate reductase